MNLGLLDAGSWSARAVLQPAWFEIHSLIAGVLIGAAWMFLVAHIHPRWLGLSERSAARRRLEAVRSDLIGELRAIETQMRHRPEPVRMEPRRGEQERKHAA